MPTDILETADGDIDFSSGDIVYTESTQQHERDLLYARKGDYKAAPGVGVGVENYLKDERAADMLPEIRRQFTNDGMTVRSLKLTSNGDKGTVTIDASY